MATALDVTAAGATAALLLLAGLATATACTGGESRRDAAATSGGAVTVAVERRATVAGFARDTLSATARITALYPGTGADSSLVAFTFADSARGVGAGLGVLDLRAPDGERLARLAWPDSVAAAWWSAPHVLSFTTSRGVKARVDASAATLDVVVDSAGAHGGGGGGGPTATAPPAAASVVPSAAQTRATTFVDSAHGQPSGAAAPRSALRYAVDSLIAAPTGRFVALYVTAADATDRSGRHVNPAWYALALPSGVVAPIDSVVGPVTELPASTGAWGGPDSATFWYARGRSVYGARVR